MEYGAVPPVSVAIEADAVVEVTEPAESVPAASAGADAPYNAAKSLMAPPSMDCSAVTRSGVLIWMASWTLFPGAYGNIPVVRYAGHAYSFAPSPMENTYLWMAFASALVPEPAYTDRRCFWMP